MRLAGEPPSFTAYAMRPIVEWHDAQDSWLAKFSESRSTLPIAGEPGSAESKARAAAWRAVTKQYGRAKRMAAAVTGDAEANIVLNQLAGVASTRHAQKHGWLDNDTPWHPRPPGPSPHGFEWHYAQGRWLDDDGQLRPRPRAASGGCSSAMRARCKCCVTNASGHYTIHVSGDTGGARVRTLR